MTQNDSPIVDIIVPCYNAARFLPAALNSVLAQTFTRWRILLMDDGSTDATPEIAAGYAARLGPRMLHLHQPNRGLPAARNAAIRAGSAPLLALLDADDEWLPQRLALSVAAFDQRPEIGLSYGFVSRVDEHNRHVSTHDQLLPGREGSIAASIYTRRIHLPCPTVTFRRTLFDRTGGFDESMRATEDRDLWLRIALHAPVACIPEVIALYRVSPGAMTTETDRMFQSQLRFIQKHRGASGLGEPEYRRALSSIHRQRAETEGNRRHFQPALKDIVRALWLFPASRENWQTAGSILKHGWRSKNLL